MEGFLFALGLAVVAFVYLGIPVLCIVAVVKFWEWRREYRHLLKRVSDLEARIAAQP